MRRQGTDVLGLDPSIHKAMANRFMMALWILASSART